MSKTSQISYSALNVEDYGTTDIGENIYGPQKIEGSKNVAPQSLNLGHPCNISWTKIVYFKPILALLLL